MDKRPIGYQPGKGTVLDKKVPKTSKYDHVESKLAGKTGVTVKDVEYMSIIYIYPRSQGSIQKERIAISKNQAINSLEDAESVSQNRIHL